MNTAIAAAVTEGNVYDMEELVNSALTAGENPKDLLEAMMSGLKACGDRFESGEYFLPELMGAGEAFTVGMKVLAPELAPGDRTSRGTVVLGTVRGDVHDIGKNPVGFMLESSGFTVVNLGVDVSAEAFAQAVRDHKSQVLGLSGLLTHHHAGHGGCRRRAEAPGLARPGEGDHRWRSGLEEVCGADRRRRLWQ